MGVVVVVVVVDVDVVVVDDDVRGFRVLDFDVCNDGFTKERTEVTSRSWYRLFEHGHDKDLFFCFNYV